MRVQADEILTDTEACEARKRIQYAGSAGGDVIARLTEMKARQDDLKGRGHELQGGRRTSVLTMMPVMIQFLLTAKRVVRIEGWR